MEKPAGLDNWTHKYIDEVPTDKWGHKLIYRCPGTVDPASYDLLSAGPDGIEGTADDITKNTQY